MTWARRRARQLDHRAGEVVDGDAAFGDDGLGDGLGAFIVQLRLEADERHHDLGLDGGPCSSLPPSTAASKMARACISAISG